MGIPPSVFVKRASQPPAPEGWYLDRRLRAYVHTSGAQVAQEEVEADPGILLYTDTSSARRLSTFHRRSGRWSHCKNCGAPREQDKCSYCGTHTGP